MCPPVDPNETLEEKVARLQTAKDELENERTTWSTRAINAEAGEKAAKKELLELQEEVEKVCTDCSTKDLKALKSAYKKQERDLAHCRKYHNNGETTGNGGETAPGNGETTGNGGETAPGNGETTGNGGETSKSVWDIQDKNAAAEAATRRDKFLKRGLLILAVVLGGYGVWKYFHPTATRTPAPSATPSEARNVPTPAPIKAPIVVERKQQTTTVSRSTPKPVSQTVAPKPTKHENKTRAPHAPLRQKPHVEQLRKRPAPTKVMPKPMPSDDGEGGWSEVGREYVGFEKRQ